MEEALDSISKSCAMQLQMYASCVEKNPTDWSHSCIKEKQYVTRCAEESVPGLKKVKQMCAQQIKAYQDCLKTDTSDPSNCASQVKALYECHNSVGREN